MARPRIFSSLVSEQLRSATTLTSTMRRTEFIRRRKKILQREDLFANPTDLMRQEARRIIADALEFASPPALRRGKTPKLQIFSEACHAWQKSFPASRRHFVECPPSSWPRFARDLPACGAPPREPPTHRLPNRAWTAGFSCLLTSESRTREAIVMWATPECLFGARLWNRRQRRKPLGGRNSAGG